MFFSNCFATFVALSVVVFLSSPAKADASLEELKTRVEKAERENLLLKAEKLERENLMMKAEKLEQENAKLKAEAYSNIGNTKPSGVQPPQQKAKALQKVATTTSAIVLSNKDFSASNGTVVAARVNEALANIPKDDERREMTAAYKTTPIAAQLESKSWQGVYGGINGAYGGNTIGTTTWNYNPGLAGLASLGNAKSNFVIGGGLVGGQIGYNFQFANHMLIGLETDINYANISNANNSTSNLYSSYPSIQQGIITNSYERLGLNWLGSTRVRLGYSFNNLLPYLTGGISYGQMTSSLSTSGVMSYNFSNSSGTSFNSSSGTTNQNQAGWIIGAGLEYKFADAWSIKSEYLFSSLAGITRNDMNIFNGAIFSFTKTTNDTFSIHQARVGLNYHTGWGAVIPAVTAKY